MSSLADQLKAKKDKLTHTTTLVTSSSGQSWVEDSHNNTTNQVLSSQRPGFVIDNRPDLRVTRILDKLLIGSQDVAHDLELLNENKVSHILNVATGIINLFEGWFIYKTIEALDIPEFRLLEILDESCEFINNAISSGGCVLVHCNAGVSRSASIVIAYVMKCYSMTFDEAFRFVKGKRQFIRPNEGFLEQLKLYEKILDN